MKKTTKFLLSIFTFAALVSCRDIDNEKDLNRDEDGTREINTTELDRLDNRAATDSTDFTDTTGVGEGVYRTNDIPPRKVRSEKIENQ